jgi:hypothetical protein
MRTFRAVVAASILLIGAGACSDDGGEPDASGSTSGSASGSASGVAPEELRATPEAVAAGLGALTGLVDQIAETVGVDDEQAAELVEGIEAIWEPIEGTVLENDQDAYLVFEDNFAVLGNAAEDGDTDLATQAQTAISDEADSYLAEFPG